MAPQVTFRPDLELENKVKKTSERTSGNEATNIELTWPVKAVLDVSQGLGAHQGDTVLLTVVEGGDRAELGVQLAELVTLSPNMGKTCCVQAVETPECLL